jgi:polyisoprenoid-binding protein YceI
MRKWLIGVLAVLAVLAVVAGVLLASLQSLVGVPPDRLTLPRTPVGSSAPGAALDGVWQAGAGSAFGWRLRETVIGRQVTVAARSTKVSGSITVSGTSVSSGSFVASMSDVMTGPTQRKVMDVNAYPAATFELTSPVALGSIPPAGAVRQVPATGRLSVHGVTRPVNVTVSAERLGDAVYALVDIPITFADWNISIPDSGAFGTPDRTGTAEVLLHLTQARG